MRGGKKKASYKLNPKKYLNVLIIQSKDDDIDFNELLNAERNS